MYSRARELAQRAADVVRRRHGQLAAEQLLEGIEQERAASAMRRLRQARQWAAEQQRSRAAAEAAAPDPGLIAARRFLEAMAARKPGAAGLPPHLLARVCFEESDG